MTGCYLTTLPYNFMRALAGFDPSDTRSYFVPRATIKPPRKLLCQIWPELDAWITAFKNPEESGVETTMAADGFLELLTWLREVVLQDAVDMRKHFPTHPIFREPVFHTAEFESFAELVTKVCEEAPIQSYHAIVEKANSAVANALRDLHHQQTYVGREVAAMKGEMMGEIMSLKGQISEFMNSEIRMSWVPSGRAMAMKSSDGNVIRPIARTVIRSTQQVPSLTENRQQPVAISYNSSSAGPSSAPARPSVHPGIDPDSSVPVPANAISQDARRELDAAEVTTLWNVPRVATVVGLLKLWRHGMAPMPSIDSLVAEHGETESKKWRVGTKSEDAYFYSRRTIVKEVEERARVENVPEQTIAARMDTECKGSLDKVMRMIRAQKKARSNN